MAKKNAETAATKATKSEMKRTPKPVPIAGEGFAGLPPEQEGWFATNHICFKNGVLHQLHKSKADDGRPDYWWFPVKEAE